MKKNYEKPYMKEKLQRANGGVMGASITTLIMAPNITPTITPVPTSVPIVASINVIA